jgi:hypothetical protein
MAYNWWRWRQTLSWKLAYRLAQAGRRYSCPWWADEHVYCLGWLDGRGLEIPKADLVNRKKTRRRELAG